MKMNSTSAIEFYQRRLGSPKYVIAPMVEASELAWRILSRRYGAELCYTPMLHASIFIRDLNYRKAIASCKEDRPLIVQFCGNDPDVLYEACKLAENHCDAIDLNLGCPQGLAKRGHFGAYLQDDWELIESIVRRCSRDVKVPFTAKIRIFPELEKTIKYAKMLEAAGCYILTVHGRTIEQKGPLTGLADWSYIKAVKESVSIPVFANGNIQYLEDVHRCLEETGVDGVMTAEGNLHNPAIFKGIQPLVWEIALEYLDIVETYPCRISIVRGHLFKLCQHAFSVHTYLRPKLSLAGNITEIREVMNELKTSSLADVALGIEGYKGDLPHPYWFCQPYVRPPVRESGKSKSDVAESTTAMLDNLKVSSRISASPSSVKETTNKNLNKLLKKGKKSSTEPCEKLLCGSCCNLKGVNCDFGLCKNCCKRRILVTEIPCEGHKRKSNSMKGSTKE